MFKKSLICFFVAISLSINVLVISVFADDGIKVMLNGNQIQFDVQPQIINNRTLVPMRAIFESLGATVTWNETLKSVDATLGKKTITIFTTVPTAISYGKVYTLDVTPIIINGRTMIPLRFVSEALGANVNWNDEKRQVDINTTTAIGSRENPIPSKNNEVIPFQAYSFYKVKNVCLSVEGVIKGAEANTIVNSENRFNDKPTVGQEWRIYTFNLKYIAGEEELKASDIIVGDNFYTQQGSNLLIHSTGTLGKKYKGYGIFDVKLYSGGNSKVIYMLLVDSSAGTPMLKIPTDAGEGAKWILCDGTNNIAINNTTSIPNSKIKTYSDYPTVPDFGAMFGIEANLRLPTSKGDVGYYYNIIKVKEENVSSYIATLKSLGFEFFTSFKSNKENTVIVYRKDGVAVMLGVSDASNDYTVVISNQ